MKTPNQGGATDCGLYAIAKATALALGIDQCQQIFRQEDMRSHLIDCVANRKLELFPAQKKQRIINNVSSTVKLYLCPTCEKPDYGDPIVVATAVIVGSMTLVNHHMTQAEIGTAIHAKKSTSYFIYKVAEISVPASY